MGEGFKVIKIFSCSFCLQNRFTNRSYVEYIVEYLLLRADNGQESSIIDHFPPEVDLEPSIGVKIALYSEIHQAPSLETLIHIVFPTLAINYTNQGYMDGQAILTTKNIVVNFSKLRLPRLCPGEKTYFCRQTHWKWGTTKLWRLT